MEFERKKYKFELEFLGWFAIFVAIVSPITIITLSYISNLEIFKGIGTFLTRLTELGPIGDFIGGSSVAFLTFASVIFLIITIRLQKTELRETRKELKLANQQYQITNNTMIQQQFETKFYNLLNLLQLKKSLITIKEVDENLLSHPMNYTPHNKGNIKYYTGVEAFHYVFSVLQIDQSRLKIFLEQWLDNYLDRSNISAEEFVKRNLQLAMMVNGDSNFDWEYEYERLKLTKSDEEIIDFFNMNCKMTFNLDSDELNDKMQQFYNVPLMKDLKNDYTLQFDYLNNRLIEILNRDNKFPFESYINVYKIIVGELELAKTSKEGNLDVDLYHKIFNANLSHIEKSIIRSFG